MRTRGRASGSTAAVKYSSAPVDFRADGRKRPLLSVIAPTKNEAGNIAELVGRLERVAADVPMEIIFVDDSDDGTPEAIRKIRRRSKCDIKLIIRPPDQRSDGLGGAVVEGLRVALAPWVCVMDADLQHPPELIPSLMHEAKQSDADLVLASRYRGKGGRQGLGFAREAISRTFVALARLAFPLRLKRVSDPLTGYFLVRREAIEVDRLRPRGFKILLEMLVRIRGLRVSEIPFRFDNRCAGKSKASLREGMQYLRHLWRLRLSDSPVRFGRFAVVGVSGLLVNSLVLVLAVSATGMNYLPAAVLATQGSTLWNFAFTEFWVFPDRRQSKGRVPRLVMFALVNNVAFVFRGPMLFVLTTGIGIHYLMSNLISLLTLTLVRYALADTWIWGGSRRREGEVSSYGYDIHGIVTVVSDTPLPELERFYVPHEVEQPTIRVRVGKLDSAPKGADTTPAVNARRMRYDEGLGSLGFAVDIDMGDTIDVVASPLLKHSSHVLYTNVVEPILRWTFVERGYALVHAACIASGDDAYLITARTDTGKTTTILKLLDNHPLFFLSDDLTLIQPDGQVLMYPKPLTISRHTAKAVKTPLLSRRERLGLFIQSRVHSRSGRTFADFIKRSGLPAATINAVAQFLIPPPKYHVERLVPGVRKTRQASLAGLAVIERGGEGQRRLDHEEATDILMRNCEDAYGFPPYSDIEDFLHSSNGRNLKPVERSIVAKALKGCPATLLRSNTMDWWQRIPAVMGLVGRLGIPSSAHLLARRGKVPRAQVELPGE
jgi:glycosyltransferase involved in cell wall biosynthesis